MAKKTAAASKAAAAAAADGPMDEAAARAAVRRVMLAKAEAVGDVRMVIKEFPRGWLISPRPADRSITIGGITYVVDNTDGAVRFFSSATPASGVIEQYDEFCASTPADPAGFAPA
jgi:hypothetical protein